MIPIPRSSIPDIGKHVLMLTPELAEALAAHPLEDSVAARRQMLEDFADYLSRARVVGQEHLFGARHPTDVLTDGTWTWYRKAVYYVRTFGCADMRLFAHAMHHGFVLDPEYLNPDYAPAPPPNERALEREEHATWRG